MNGAHVHLLFNHFPTIAFSIGLALFVAGLFWRRDMLIRASLVIFFLTAAVTILTYVSGNDAQQGLKDNPDIPNALVLEHESAALVAFVFMQLTGFFSWLALWLWRRILRVPNWNFGIILILSVISFALMARAANLGGEIRHAEIMAQGQHAAESAAEEPKTIARSFGMYVEAHSWVWPTCETLHFIGLSLLFGVVLTVDLRLLGVGKIISFDALYQLLPLGMLGFTLNLATGMAFFVSTPHQYTGWLFFAKMVLVALGAVNVLYFMLLEEPWTVGEGKDASFPTKVVAASAIFIWIAVLFCGHMLPFLGNSF